MYYFIFIPKDENKIVYTEVVKLTLIVRNRSLLGSIGLGLRLELGLGLLLVLGLEFAWA